MSVSPYWMQMREAPLWGSHPKPHSAIWCAPCGGGVGFSIRQGVEAIGQKPSHISIIGGGGRVTDWCQILSDILGQTIYVYRNADTLPARAIAAAVLIGQNLQPDYTAFVQGLQQEGSADVFHPDVSAHAQYDALYARYVQLYPILKQWYELNHM